MARPVPQTDVVPVFLAALEDLNCLVLRTTVDNAPQALVEFLRAREITEVVAWNDEAFPGLRLGAAARAAGVAWYPAHPEVNPEQYRAKAARAGAGVTGVTWAVAETGTLVLMSGPGRPRSTSLLPPVHVAVVRRQQILGTMADLFAHLSGLAATGDFPSAVNMITGASRTADIEHVLVRKVHGPGEVVVLLV